MNRKDSQTNLIQLLPLTVILWLGYLSALALIDHTFYPRPVYPLLYYLANGLNILVVLGLILWHRNYSGLEKIFLPLVIGLMSIVPIVIGKLIILPLSPSPARSPEAMAFRLMPILFMALILTAWQYRWRHVIGFSGGIALFMIGLHFLFLPPGGSLLLPPVTVVVIQTVSFLVVGYFISTLIQQLQQKQESLMEANTQLTHYATTLEELTISRERNRMARELHDTLAHTLSALSVQLETVKAYWDVDPAVAQKMLEKSLQATRSGLQETRRALKSLRASPLDDLGLSLALRQMADETSRRANLHLNLLIPEQLPALSAETEQTIYRIAQEAVANVAHHANARILTLQLTMNGNSEMMLLVSDDGIGFHPQQVESPGHFGLSGMRERAQLAGGKLHVSSQPGQGTTIQLKIQDRRKNENHHL